MLYYAWLTAVCVCVCACVSFVWLRVLCICVRGTVHLALAPFWLCIQIHCARYTLRHSDIQRLSAEQFIDFACKYIPLPHTYRPLT